MHVCIVQYVCICSSTRQSYSYADIVVVRRAHNEYVFISFIIYLFLQLITASSIIVDIGGHARRYYECPLCRTKMPITSTKTKLLTKNFVIGAIIDSICELANDKALNADGNLRFANRRLKSQLIDAQTTIATLRRENDDANANIVFWRYLSIGLIISAVVGALFL